MKYFILLLVYISVAAAFRVVETEAKSNPEAVSTPDGTKTPDLFLGTNPESPEISEDGFEPIFGTSSPSIFGRLPSFSSMMKWVEDSFNGMLAPFRMFGSEPSETETLTGSPRVGVPSLLGGLLEDDVGSHMGIPDGHNLPPNYSNKTSEIHHSNDSKLIVNKTIHKNSGDGFSNFYMMKTYQLVPNNETKKDQEEQENTDIYSNAERTKSIPKSNDRLNEVDYEGNLDSIEKNNQAPVSTNTVVEPDLKVRKHTFIKREIKDKYDLKMPKLRRMRRDIKDKIISSSSFTGKSPIVFPASELNRFPQSFLNNRNIKMEDLKSALGGPISKSYVYKNIGGKTTMYIVDHKPKSQSDYDDNEIIKGGFRPPDLSRDTKVNPSGNDDQQQSLVLAEPDAEVFDLNLVAKEIESRPKHK